MGCGHEVPVGVESVSIGKVSIPQRTVMGPSDAEAELQIQLHRTDGRLLRAIEEALVRIKKRTYGVCEACGHPISRLRLNAVPWTRHCRECKERQIT